MEREEAEADLLHRVLLLTSKLETCSPSHKSVRQSSIFSIFHNNLPRLQMMPNRPVVYRGTLGKKIVAVFCLPKKEMRKTHLPHFLFGKANTTNRTMNTMKQSISLDQAQIKLLVDHLHEISDPEPGVLEILSILEPILEVSTKFIGCLKF